MPTSVLFERNRVFSPIKKLCKEYAKLFRETWSNGQIRFELEDESKLNVVSLYLTPNDGLYYGAEVKFIISLDMNLDGNPHVQCNTSVFHPNIENGEICLNVLEESDDMSLEDIAHALLWLLNNPNFDDPLACLPWSTSDKKENIVRIRECIVGDHEALNHYPCIMAEGVTREDIMGRPLIWDVCEVGCDCCSECDCDFRDDCSDDDEDEEEENVNDGDPLEDLPMLFSGFYDAATLDPFSWLEMGTSTLFFEEADEELVDNSEDDMITSIRSLFHLGEVENNGYESYLEGIDAMFAEEVEEHRPSNEVNVTPKVQTVAVKSKKTLPVACSEEMNNYEAPPATQTALDVIWRENSCVSAPEPA